MAFPQSRLIVNAVGSIISENPALLHALCSSQLVPAAQKKAVACWWSQTDIGSNRCLGHRHPTGPLASDGLSRGASPRRSPYVTLEVPRDSSSD
ncbi:hypothetical protein EYF80_004985 [Liparis tanakae]|uniref:Uncharacterized protein n=1 Tax=Liparis tanakae TaxID=230148 RepID=A0A4Z2J425_9TELE|nr:hypothetical protein EYF80_004985 [Liparis tanakae]